MIQMRGRDVTLARSERFVVPNGVKHRGRGLPCLRWRCVTGSDAVPTLEYSSKWRNGPLMQ